MNWLIRSCSFTGIAVTLLAVGAGVASAHVTVAAPGVTVGQSDAAITFRVPDESATASTVSLKVHLPTSTPIAGVLVAPVTGWTAKITNTKLAKPITTDDGTITEVVSEVDWTANGGAGIGPGFFGQFTVIAGQLPDDVKKLTFKAIQTYSDGKVVSWIEEAAPGSTEEPEHPAPELTLLPAAGDADAAPASSGAPASAGAAPSPAVAAVPAAAATSAAGAPTSAAAAPAAVTVTAAPLAMASTSSASKGSVTTAIVIAILGLAVGIAGVGLALASRRRPASS